MNAARQSGFTLVEAAIVVAILGLIMAAVWNTTTTLNDTVRADSAGAEVMTQARRYVSRLARLLRAAKLTTMQVQAEQADVDAGLATVVGEWTGIPEGVWRHSIRFDDATGLLSMNAALSTSPRSMVFHLDPGEIANGLDDNSNGLVDEGHVSLLYEGVEVDVLLNVEECSYELEGRLLSVRVRVGQRDNKHRVYRATVIEQIYLRNN
ncbi:MAG TPA: prepilin-type N-terminal cleavage/methylation domain-containing protein [Planctomycetota bacterium]|nr:prepilin-type N-terminal cleavage/methylation domain-containing protein [Planctomycetota bacterium]